MSEPIFDDRDAAVDELTFLANRTGEPHALVFARGAGRHRWSVVPVRELGLRRPLVVCEPEVAHG